MKVFVLNKRSIIYWGAVFILAVALVITMADLIPGAVAASAMKRKLPIYNVDRPDKSVSLSFDAAWGNTAGTTQRTATLDFEYSKRL